MSDRLPASGAKEPPPYPCLDRDGRVCRPSLSMRPSLRRGPNQLCRPWRGPKRVRAGTCRPAGTGLARLRFSQFGGGERFRNET